ncbi:MAG: helix-turn-helix domain-containing protein [Halobacteriovoraceae bacterium]|nr:helix-turn-helix domain-containing protein [Halobacteriovoraceae bacterium]
MSDDRTLIILQNLGNIIEKLNKDTFSIEEAAEYLKIPVESVDYYSRRQKQLSYINLGGKLVFRRKDLEDFLDKKVKKGFVF